MNCPTEKSQWVLCPFCHSKTRVKLLPGTLLRHFPLFCPKCRQEAVICAEGGTVTLEAGSLPPAPAAYTPYR